MRTTTIAVVLGVTLGLCGPLAADGSGDYELVLDDALGEGKDLTLCVHFDGEGNAARAFSFARRYNRMPHSVELGTLKLEGGEISGKAVATIPFDGWVPKGGKPLTVEMTIDAKVGPDAVAGTYEASFGGNASRGALVGEAFETPGKDAVRRLELRCERSVRGKRRMRNIGMVLSARDGKVFAARLVPAGSLTDVGMVARAGEQDLTLSDGRLRGTLKGRIDGQGKRPVVDHLWEFDVRVIGNRAAGTLNVTAAGEKAGLGRCTGTVRTGAPDPGDALWTLTLHDTLPGKNFLNLRLATAGGKVLHGFATSPNWNNSIHTVDTSKLELDDGRLVGKLGVTILPDAWIPKDHKPVACRYALDVRAVDGEARGTSTGVFGKEPTKGTIEGSVEPKPDLKMLRSLTLKVENGGFGRGFISCKFAEGKFAEGRLWNNHSDLTGEVKSVDLSFANETATGTLVTTARKGNVKSGTYTVNVDGVMVGMIGAGEATTVHTDGSEKTTTFWVAVRPAE